MRNISRNELAQALRDARRLTLTLVDDLQGSGWQVPYLTVVNPPLWEIGHVAWFQEHWCLRWQGSSTLLPSRLNQADDWFDSRDIGHPERWSLPLPAPAEVRAYMNEVLEASIERLEHLRDTSADLYFHRLSLFHEYMHIEAQAYTWQTLGRPLALPMQMPRFDRNARYLPFTATDWQLGSSRDMPFVFDNEKWSHAVVASACELADRPVTNGEYLSFVAAGGYEQPQWWDADYFAAMQLENRHLPVYWRRHNGQLERRHFDQWQPIPEHEPVVHVSAFEAEACCRWLGGSLPTEAQWERAAMTNPEFRWGDSVWEWTADDFGPFTGFSPDPYAEYSVPAFGNTRVVRGGSCLTPRGLVHPKFRNYFAPARADLIIGFRLARPLAD